MSRFLSRLGNGLLLRGMRGRGFRSGEDGGEVNGALKLILYVHGLPGACGGLIRVSLHEVGGLPEDVLKVGSRRGLVGDRRRSSENGVEVHDRPGRFDLLLLAGSDTQGGEQLRNAPVFRTAVHAHVRQQSVNALLVSGELVLGAGNIREELGPVGYLLGLLGRLFGGVLSFNAGQGHLCPVMPGVDLGHHPVVVQRQLKVAQFLQYLPEPEVGIDVVYLKRGKGLELLTGFLPEAKAHACVCQKASRLGAGADEIRGFQEKLPGLLGETPGEITLGVPAQGFVSIAGERICHADPLTVCIYSKRILSTRREGSAQDGAGTGGASRETLRPWRRGRDSNPRGRKRPTRFPTVLLRPTRTPLPRRRV